MLPQELSDAALDVPSDFFEPLARYEPNSELLTIVKTIVPADWIVARRDIWYGCHPADAELPDQGWKAHVSATPDNCDEILRRVTAICVRRGLAFKFAVDKRMASLLNSKATPRGSAGKFVTVYPPSEESLRVFLEEAAHELSGFAGPYILSDRRFGDCRVLYYRYGGFARQVRVQPDGTLLSVVLDNSGQPVPDIRRPTYRRPAWVADLIEDREVEAVPDALVLNHGRYHVREAFRFSNSGGVYRATDMDTGRDVVLKEARPFVAVGRDGRDAVDRLRAEFGVLQKLSGLGVSPEPFEFFSEWEHSFFSMELLAGAPLIRYVARRNPLVIVSPTENDLLERREELRRLWLNLARALRAVHSRSIVLGDLTPSNVLLDESTMAVQLIDFEGAFEFGSDSSDVGLFTPGYASPRHMRHGARDFTDDYYSLGAVFLATTVFAAPAFQALDPTSGGRFLRDAVNEGMIPDAFASLTLELLSEDPSCRPNPENVIEQLETGGTSALKGARAPRAHEDVEDWGQLDVTRMTDFILSTADPRRSDRLFPADPALYESNPMSLAYGACGVMYALRRLGADLPSPALNWILGQNLSLERYPRGLHHGLAGIGWAFAELGYEEIGARVLGMAGRDIDGRQGYSLSTGVAGYGLACLRLWLSTGESRCLEDASCAAAILAKAAAVDARGANWLRPGEPAHIGFSNGASGIALFLLYFSLVSGDDEYLQLGEAAVRFDLSHGRRLNGRLTFPREADDWRVYPYLEVGAGGIATTVLRYAAVTGSESYINVLNDLLPDLACRYTVFPALFLGLAGIGNVLLDFHLFTGDSSFLDAAERAAGGIRLFALDREHGIAFPGHGLTKISVDLATGSAGIALFVSRLHSKGPNFMYVLDELLPDAGAGSLARFILKAPIYAVAARPGS